MTLNLNIFLTKHHLFVQLAYQRFKALLVGLISVALFSTAAPAWAGLPQGNAVKDPAAILRDALPFEQADIRELQHRLELTSDDLRAKRWPALGKTVSRSEALLNTRRNTMLDAVPTDRCDKAAGLLELVGIVGPSLWEAAALVVLAAAVFAAAGGCELPSA